MVKWTGSRIAALSLHHQRNSNRTLLLAPQTLPFIVLYAWALQQVKTKGCLVVIPTVYPYHPIPTLYFCSESCMLQFCLSRVRAFLACAACSSLSSVLFHPPLPSAIRTRFHPSPLSSLLLLVV